VGFSGGGDNTLQDPPPALLRVRVVFFLDWLLRVSENYLVRVFGRSRMKIGKYSYRPSSLLFHGQSDSPPYPERSNRVADRALQNDMTAGTASFVFFEFLWPRRVYAP